MSDPISVLLLIGAAVVGPIASQPIGDAYCFYGSETKMVVPLGYFNAEPELREVCKDGPGEVLRQPMETFLQLCDRAMREIGVIDLADGAKILPRRPTVAGTSLEGSPEVFCVRVPAGYKK